MFGWNAPQETWHLALVRTPAPPRTFPGPHLAPPPPRQLFPPRGCTAQVRPQAGASAGAPPSGGQDQAGFALP